MLIISKFKDYYDSVAYSKGVDKTIVYNRETKEVENYKLAADNKWRETKEVENYKLAADNKWRDSLPYFYNSLSYNQKGEESAMVNILGFCGKLYPYCVIKKKLSMYETETKITFNMNEIKETFKAEFKYGSSFNDYFNFLDRTLNDKNIQNIFFEHKCPIFVIQQHRMFYKYKLILNPELNDLRFVKLMEPYTTFQEIEMYISGVLGIDSQKTIEVSDKSKIEGHGFDYKWSFRKEKQ